MLRDRGMSEEQATRMLDSADKFATVATVATIILGFWAMIKMVNWVFDDGTNGKADSKEAIEIAQLKEKVATLEKSEASRDRYS
jgi:hypothetical protein